MDEQKKRKLDIGDVFIFVFMPVIGIVGASFFLQLAEPNKREIFNLEVLFLGFPLTLGIVLAITARNYKNIGKTIILLLGIVLITGIRYKVQFDIGKIIGFYLGAFFVGVKLLNNRSGNSENIT